MLTEETQALLNQAFDDKSAAEAAMADFNASKDVLAQSQQALIDAQQAQIDAQVKATQSAHAALAAVASELGFPLPV